MTPHTLTIRLDPDGGGRWNDDLLSIRLTCPHDLADLDRPCVAYEPADDCPLRSPVSDADSICPACADPIDYCPGHGELGDPIGHHVLTLHDDDVHDECHELSPCRPCPQGGVDTAEWGHMHPMAAQHCAFVEQWDDLGTEAAGWAEHAMPDDVRLDVQVAPFFDEGHLILDIVPPTVEPTDG